MSTENAGVCTLTGSSVAFVAAGTCSSFVCPGPFVLARSFARQSVTRWVDAADGGSTSLTVGPVSIDRVAPTVSVTGVRDGGRYRGDGPRPHCAAHDGLSGLARCVLDVTRHGLRVTVRARATDRAGNAAVRIVHYRVHFRVR